MSKQKHSMVFYKKKQALEEAEKQLRDELEEASVQTQSALVSVLKVIGISFVAIGIGYGVYRQFFSGEKKAEVGKKSETPENSEIKNPPKEPSLDPLTGKIVSTVATTLITALIGAFSRQLNARK